MMALMGVEAIYKLKCGIFALKNTGKILQTQKKHREFNFNLSVATLYTFLC